LKQIINIVRILSRKSHGALCDPIDEVGEEKVRSIAGKAIGSLYENWKRPGSIKAPVPFGFALLKAVSPKQIRDSLALKGR